MGRYVALGDSMSIDVYAGGHGRGAASLLHRNRDQDFPRWAGRDLLHRGFTAENLAQDGATSTDVLRHQVPRLRDRADLVTITMGGNDLMMAYGRADAAEAMIVQVLRRSEAILETVRSVAGGDSAVVVTTVYDPSDGTGAVPGNVLPPWPDGPRLVQALNAGLTDVARRHGALVADVHAAFHGHGSTIGDPGQPHPRPDNHQLWYCGVIEPNAWGAHQIRRVWWDTLRAAGVLS